MNSNDTAVLNLWKLWNNDSQVSDISDNNDTIIYDNYSHLNKSSTIKGIIALASITVLIIMFTICSVIRKDRERQELNESW